VVRAVYPGQGRGMRLVAEEGSWGGASRRDGAVRRPEQCAGPHGF